MFPSLPFKLTHSFLLPLFSHSKGNIIFFYKKRSKFEIPIISSESYIFKTQSFKIKIKCIKGIKYIVRVKVN